MQLIYCSNLDLKLFCVFWKYIEINPHKHEIFSILQNELFEIENS